MRTPLVIVHHAGQTALLDRTADEHAFSSFGGPVDVAVSGMPLLRPLHQIALLDRNQFDFLGPPSQVFDLPLLHPMRYSGGTLRYALEHEGVVVKAMEPQRPTDDWPYAGFPDLLPYHPLKLTGVVTQDWNRFRDRAPGLPVAQPAEVVVLVPPPRGLGFTLWGRGGDAEGVTIVFECSIAGRQVVTYNVCS